MNSVEIVEVLLAVLFGAGVSLASLDLLRRGRNRPTPHDTKSVDNYKIAHSDGDFPSVLITFQLDDRTVHGPFSFVPPFAHMLADELTIASIRAAPKRSSTRGTLIDDARSDADELISDDGGSGGVEHG